MAAGQQADDQALQLTPGLVLGTGDTGPGDKNTIGYRTKTAKSGVQFAP